MIRRSLSSISRMPAPLSPSSRLNYGIGSSFIGRAFASARREPPEAAMGEGAGDSLLSSAGASSEAAAPMGKFQYILTLGLLGAGAYALYEMFNHTVESNMRPEMMFPMRDIALHFLQSSVPHIFQDPELVAHFGKISVAGEQFGMNKEGGWYLLTIFGDKTDADGQPRVGTAMLEMMQDQSEPPEGAERSPYDWVFLHVDVDLQNGRTKRFVFAKKLNLEETVLKMQRLHLEMQRKQREREMKRKMKQQQQQQRQ